MREPTGSLDGQLMARRCGWSLASCRVRITLAISSEPHNAMVEFQLSKVLNIEYPSSPRTETLYALYQLFRGEESPAVSVDGGVHQ